MIKINDLVKNGDFKEFINKYNDKVEYIELFDIALNDMLSSKKYDVLSLEQLYLIYNTCKNNMDEETFEDIKFGLFKSFPNLDCYIVQKEENEKNKLELDKYLRDGINFNYDNKYHVYVPCECGVKCLVTGDVIGGCESQEEIDFLINCFRTKGILLDNYKADDFYFVSDLLMEDGIFDDQDNISSIYFDSNKQLEEDLYFNSMSELTEDIDKKLMGKHNTEDFFKRHKKVNVKK